MNSDDAYDNFRAVVGDIFDFVITWAKEFGPDAGLAVLVFLVTQFYQWKAYKMIVETMQKEIDRLADDNHKYRDIFLEFVGMSKDKIKQITPQDDNESR